MLSKPSKQSTKHLKMKDFQWIQNISLKFYAEGKLLLPLNGFIGETLQKHAWNMHRIHKTWNMQHGTVTYESFWISNETIPILSFTLTMKLNLPTRKHNGNERLRCMWFCEFNIIIICYYYYYYYYNNKSNLLFEDGLLLWFDYAQRNPLQNFVSLIVVIVKTYCSLNKNCVVTKNEELYSNFHFHSKCFFTMFSMFSMFSSGNNNIIIAFVFAYCSYFMWLHVSMCVNLTSSYECLFVFCPENVSVQSQIRFYGSLIRSFSL